MKTNQVMQAQCNQSRKRQIRRKGVVELKRTNPEGRLSTKVINILSLLPPSEARPACISTSMASATSLSFAIGVPHCFSNSLTMATARPHFPELLMWWRTTSAAAAQAAAAQTTATPAASLPIIWNELVWRGRSRI